MDKKPTALEQQLIRHIRDSGLLQLDLARLSGVSQPALSRFLEEDPLKRRSIHLPTADKLCRALGLELVKTKDPGPLRKARKKKEKRL